MVASPPHEGSAEASTRRSRRGSGVIALSDVLRVLVVSPETLWRRGLSRLIDAEPDLEVSEGESLVSAEASGACAGTDVVVFRADAGTEGSESDVARLFCRFPQVAFVAVIGLDRVCSASTMFAAGVRGLVAQDAAPHELIHAVRETADGHAFASRSVLRRMLEVPVRASRPTVRVPLGRHESLSTREHMTVALLLAGKTNSEIARSMHLSEATVKSHLSRVMTKWGARDRVQVVIRAFAAGLSSSPGDDIRSSTGHHSESQSS